MSYSIVVNGQHITLGLDSEELSRGGQGKIYKIISPTDYREYCVKIYLDENHAKVNKSKVEYMIQHRPSNAKMRNIQFCWPTHVVYNEKKMFVGFMMPLALGFPDCRDLKILEVYHIGKTIAQRYKKYPQWHNKFELNDSKGFRNRLLMMFNWALALQIIHDMGEYVVVDVKPDNVLATATGKISIVDVDSFQIKTDTTLYRGPVATLDYFPKFAKEIEKQKLAQTKDCDCFSLAVAFYKILIGCHPYCGYKLKEPYNTEDYADISSHIDEDLFVFGHKQNFIEPLEADNLHNRFHQLPKILQSLFIQSFTQIVQPSAKDWKNAINMVLEGRPIDKPTVSGPIGSVDNLEMRCLCTLVIDVSGSMKMCMGALNGAIESFIDDLREGKNGFNEHSKDIIELAIVKFDSEVEVVQRPTLIRTSYHYHELRTRNLKTNTVDALHQTIDLVEQRKQYYKSKLIPYYRPWIILLTDGNPNPYDKEKVESLMREIRRDVQTHKYMLTAIGLGTSVDKAFLAKLTNNNYAMIKHARLAKLFKLLSGSIGTHMDNPQDDLLKGLGNSIDLSL